MAHWPLPPGLAMGSRLVGQCARSSSHPFSSVTVTASATAHTKGAWSEVIASTDGDGYGLLVYLNAISSSTNDTSTLLDIGIGGAGSEVVIVADLNIGFCNAKTTMYVPVFVPSGARISARAQSAVVSKTVPMGVDVIGGGVLPGTPRASAVDTIGANAATSRGVFITAAGTANVKSAWVELIASTAAEYVGIGLRAAGGGDTTFVAAEVTIDIGIGGAGSEVVIVADVWQYSLANTEGMGANTWGLFVPLYTPIPAGTRLAARFSASATGQSIDVVAYGLRS